MLCIYWYICWYSLVHDYRSPLEMTDHGKGMALTCSSHVIWTRIPCFVDEEWRRWRPRMGHEKIVNFAPLGPLSLGSSFKIKITTPFQGSDLDSDTEFKRSPSTDFTITQTFCISRGFLFLWQTFQCPPCCVTYVNKSISNDEFQSTPFFINMGWSNSVGENLYDSVDCNTLDHQNGHSDWTMEDRLFTWESPV